MYTGDTVPETLPADENDPRIQAALAELRELIARRYPDADFTIFHGEDPDSISLRVEIDVDDLDEVYDVVVDRLVDMQVEEGLPVEVVTVWPIHRVTEYLRQQAAQPVEKRLAFLVS